VVTRQMWRGLWPRVPIAEIPIGHVTNGVHLESWVSPEMRSVLTESLGPAWLTRPLDRASWVRAREIDDHAVWSARIANRARLVRNARGWLALQAGRRARGDRTVLAPEERLDPDALTIGFVGRFVAYKRPTLFLTDPDRLTRILGDDERPVQIVFAGRAHPSDFAGKDLLRDVVRFAREAGLAHRIVFLEDFDIAMDQWLSQGVDVWLNTPRRPDEACGIAGMKAGISGALNFSTLDGWWDEVWRAADPARPPIGWVIGSDTVYASTAEQDAADAESLYDTLEHAIVPAFYDRGPDGIPRRWLGSVKESLATLGPVWTSTRMVREYTEQFYVPGREATRALRKRKGARARDLAAYLARVRAEWPGVAAHDVDAARDTMGDVHLSATVDLGALDPGDVDVQAWADPGDGRPARVVATMVPGDHAGPAGRRYAARIAHTQGPDDSLFAVRVLPRHPDLADVMSTGCITWSD
jgi:starch phosphorylase